MPTMLHCSVVVFACLMTCCFHVTMATLPDWLVTDFQQPTAVFKTEYGTLILTNGLIMREFAVYPDFATIDFYSFEKESSLLRAVNPEAIIGIEGPVYPVGGLITDTARAYMNRSFLAHNASADPSAFHFMSYNISKPEPPFPYHPKRGAPANITWPPKGLRLNVMFKAPFWAPHYHQLITVTIHYEMYDGIPLMSKWLSVQSERSSAYINLYSVEYLSVNQQWAPSGYNWMYVESDQPHGVIVNWTSDFSARAMPGSFQPVVNCTYKMAPAFPLLNRFVSFRVHELVIGSNDPTRTALAKHRMFRMLAPQTQENPIFFHMTNSTSASVREVLDQMAEVGFEMMIYSFGSGFNVESRDEKYIQSVAEDIKYARDRGIEVGGYDLIALTRKVRFEWMAIAAGQNKSTGSACFASGWYDYLKKRVTIFMDKTGLKMLATDGPYGGYSCASSEHAHHRGAEDSIYMQNKLQGDFYQFFRERDIYINQPDLYFYQGANKATMGYSEKQYSLPRWQDISVSRQGMYDDLYKRIPTAGWMFVPLIQYHGGGAAAMFEPLVDHLVEYEWALAQYLGAGVAACYRGPRLYDSDKTRAVVRKWVSFYKKYRDILISDIVHVRRPDMQSIDSFMHVNPHLQYKGLAMVFNPTLFPVQQTLTFPLYYAGLTDKATVSEQAKGSVVYTLDRDYNIHVNVNLAPLNITWFLIE